MIPGASVQIKALVVVLLAVLTSGLGPEGSSAMVGTAGAPDSDANTLLDSQDRVSCTIQWEQPRSLGVRLVQTHQLLGRTRSGVGPWVLGAPVSPAQNESWASLLLFDEKGAVDPPVSEGLPLQLVEGPGGQPLITWLEPREGIPSRRIIPTRQVDARLMASLWDLGSDAPGSGSDAWSTPEIVAELDQVVLYSVPTVTAALNAQNRVVHLIPTRLGPATFGQFTAVRGPEGEWVLDGPHPVGRFPAPELSTGIAGYWVHGGLGYQVTATPTSSRNIVYAERLPAPGPYAEDPVATLELPADADGFREPVLHIASDGRMHAAAVSRVRQPDGRALHEVWYAESTDHGSTWTTAQKAASLGMRYPDRPPMFVEDPAGELHLFLSSHQGLDDGLLQHLTLRGTRWTEPVHLEFGSRSILHGIVKSGADGTLSAAYSARPSGRSTTGSEDTRLTTHLVQGRWLCPER